MLFTHLVMALFRCVVSLMSAMVINIKGHLPAENISVLQGKTFCYCISIIFVYCY